MTNKKKSQKQRKRYQRYVEKGTIKSSGKTEHATGWLNHIIGVTDPLLTHTMPHELDSWLEVPHFVIPYTYDKNNKDELFVNFTKGDATYIEYWLTRLENEICHKHLQYAGEMFNHMLQPVNHYSTHEAVGSANSTLTMISGLRINFLRNGENPKYLKSQLKMIEHVFWMSWFFLKGYNDILTDQDVGFKKSNGKANPPLHPVHFIHYSKPLADERLYESDNTIITL